jgi:hypothetical protein
MTLNLYGAVAGCTSIVAFVVTWRLVKPQPIARKLWTFAGFAILSVPALLASTYYLHLFPDQPWFYTLRSWPGTEFLVVFLGCAGGSFASLLPNVLMGFPLFAVMAIAAIPYLKPILSPLPEDAFADRWKDGTCLPSTPSTCGPASVCSVLSRLGAKATEREVAHAAYSYSGGTEAWYLARFVRQKGFQPRFGFQDGFSPSVPLPAIVGVRRGLMGHFIAVFSISNGVVTFADPMVGEEQMPLSQFLRRYSFSGFHLSITKS